MARAIAGWKAKRDPEFDALTPIARV